MSDRVTLGGFFPLVPNDVHRETDTVSIDDALIRALRCDIGRHMSDLGHTPPLRAVLFLLDERNRGGTCLGVAWFHDERMRDDAYWEEAQWLFNAAMAKWEVDVRWETLRNGELFPRFEAKELFPTDWKEQYKFLPKDQPLLPPEVYPTLFPESNE